MAHNALSFGIAHANQHAWSDENTHKDAYGHTYHTDALYLYANADAFGYPYPYF
jgi:hypothetical protein